MKRKRQHARGTEAVLWRNPGNIRSRDLYYGPGSKELAPKPPFRFVKEVKEGGMPKFDVEDARGVKWRVKLGPEAQAETVATRLVWAVGYNAEEAYYFNKTEARYTVTDLGATLGAAAGFGGHRSKNNVSDFDRSRFVSKVENGNVKFDLQPEA